MSEQIVRLHVREDAPDPPEHALKDLRDALEDSAEVVGPDDEDIIEVKLEADEHVEAVKVVIDAVAAAGADDHFEIVEHP